MARVTLEQWRMFQAVVDAGSFARAAERVHKSPSTINHAVQKLQESLAVTLFEPEGRRVVLTPAGRMLLRRAGRLLEEARGIERVADALRGGAEPTVRVAIDQLLPLEWLRPMLSGFATRFPSTRLETFEVVLGAGRELFQQNAVEILIGTHVPEALPSRVFGHLELIPVVATGHALAQRGPLSLAELRGERQIVIRDEAERLPLDGGWAEAEARWTVSHLSSALRLVSEGFGFAWLPDWCVHDGIESGRLVTLALQETAASHPHVTLHLVVADDEMLGQAGRWMAEALTERAAGLLRRSGATPGRVDPVVAGG